MSKSKILFQLSGSIACFKACAVISRLVQDGHDVEVVATANALEFIGPATLEGLTGRKTHSDTFLRGDCMDHIHLMKWADLVILCPATANTLSKFANGVGDDLLTTMFLAHDFKKPYLVAPAMNTAMYNHPATIRALKTLREWGIQILETENGKLACGDTGNGRLLEPDKIVAEIYLALSIKDGKSIEKNTKSQLAVKHGNALHVLITSGGTREPIDGVRSITNFSTGKTAAAIAEEFIRNGHEVTFLNSRNSARPAQAPASAPEFITYNDLKKSLQRELGANHFDVVIQAAAVGDYEIDSLIAGTQKIDVKAAGSIKIDSNDGLTIKLKKTEKLVDHLREWSRNKAVQIVAFKLTNTGDVREHMRAIGKLTAQARPDFIVHNDLGGITDTQHQAGIYDCQATGSRAIATTQSKSELARELVRLLSATVSILRTAPPQGEKAIEKGVQS